MTKSYDSSPAYYLQASQMTAHEQSPLLGELMLKKGLISHDQLRIALTEQAETGLSLGHQITKLGFVSATTMRDIVANSQGHGSIDLTNLAADLVQTPTTQDRPVHAAHQVAT